MQHTPERPKLKRVDGVVEPPGVAERDA